MDAPQEPPQPRPILDFKEQLEMRICVTSCGGQWLLYPKEGMSRSLGSRKGSSIIAIAQTMVMSELSSRQLLTRPRISTPANCAFAAQLATEASPSSTGQTDFGGRRSGSDAED